MSSCSVIDVFVTVLKLCRANEASAKSKVSICEMKNGKMRGHGEKGKVYKDNVKKQGSAVACVDTCRL